MTYEIIDGILTNLGTLAASQGGYQKLRYAILDFTLNGYLRGDASHASDWVSCTIGDVMDVYSGDSISASEKQTNYTGRLNGRPYIATKDVQDWSGAIDYDNGVRIPEDGPRLKVAPAGSVLICAEGGSAGKKLGLVSQEICFGNKLFCCAPINGELEAEFLLRIFQSNRFYAKFKAEMTGIIGGISLSSFKKLPITYPRDPSRRIELLTLIDEMFASVRHVEDVADAEIRSKRGSAVSVDKSLVTSADICGRAATWEQVEALFQSMYDDSVTLTQLRDTVMELAVSGKLATNEPNELPAIAEPTFDRRTLTQINSELLPPKGALSPLPSNWRWVRLADLVNSSKPISYGVIKLGPEKTGGVPTLRCSDVKFRTIDTSSIKPIAEEIEEQFQRTRLAGGEVLINIRGTLGGCAVVPSSMAGYNIAREVAMIDPNSLVSPEYLLTVLSSPMIQRNISTNLKGIAYRGLNLGSLAEFAIPLPPHAEQQRIVDAVNAVLQSIDKCSELVSLTDRIGSQLMDALLDVMGSPPPEGAPPDRNSIKPKAESTKRSTSPLGAATTTDVPTVATNLPTAEALLVSAIIDAFFADGGEPLGNFRLQKAVYFARRRRGDALENMSYLKKAAGPYSPTMKYTGGIAIAKSENWIREAKGRYGFGHIPGPRLASAKTMINQLGYHRLAEWVTQTFKRRKNNTQWEILATVDFAVQDLKKTADRHPSPRQVLDYIAIDKEWYHKLEKLSLTEFAIQTAMLEASELFGEFGER